jgi:hypothetical protein
MEDPPELTRALDGSDLVRLFHDAQHGAFTLRVRAHLAQLFLGKVAALAAGPDPLGELDQRTR